MDAQRDADPTPPASSLDSARRWRVVLDVSRIVIISLILAFAFRAFFAEPFIIPTGSMAPGLLGDHRTDVCKTCGTESELGESPWRRDEHSTICAVCRRWNDAPQTHRARKDGDRILVHKWPIDFAPPRRWDVIVFRDPENASQTYIKRVVGLPGESIELRDGDLWIDDAPVSKPPHVQALLWRPVYDQNVPNRRDKAHETAAFRWTSSHEPTASGWSGLDSRVLVFDPNNATADTITLSGDNADAWLDFTGYNESAAGNYVRDLRVTLAIVWDDPSASCRIVVSCGSAAIVANLDASGAHQVSVTHAGIEMVEMGNTARRLSTEIEIVRADGRIEVTTSGTRIVERDLKPSAEPALENSIALSGAAGAFRVRNLRVCRDVYYTTSRRSKRAVRGEPFTLGGGEYFVLGDNSADSHDSREWEGGGPHLPADYRPGTVRADQIVGRAAMVYLPGWLKVGPWGKLPVPDVGRTRFIR